MRRFVLCFFVLYVFSCVAFSQTPLQDFLCDLTSQFITKKTMPPLTLSYPVQFFARIVWLPDSAEPQYLITVLCPEKSFPVIEAFFDTGSTAESFLDEDEIPPNIAEQMLFDMDNRAEAGIIEGLSSDVPVENAFTDGKGRLRRFSYGTEQFSLNEQHGVKTVIDSADGVIIRRTFDADNHVLTQERFSLGASARELTLLSMREYHYYADATLPNQMIETVADGDTCIVTDYDEKGFAIQQITTHTEEDRVVQDKKNVWVYDDEQRLIAEEMTTYIYTTTIIGKEKSETNVIKKIYDYTGINERKPDVSYFENGNLRMRTVYESENVYNEEMYFDGGFVVQTTYENGQKVAETVSQNGTEMRRRNFVQ